MVNHTEQYQVINVVDVIFARSLDINEPTKNGTTHITPADGNIFADLGFVTQEAAALKAESDRIIDARFAIKDHLMAELCAWMAETHLSPAEAAQKLGVTSARIIELHGKNCAQFSIESLVCLLLRAGKHHSVTVSSN